MLVLGFKTRLHLTRDGVKTGRSPSDISSFRPTGGRKKCQKRKDQKTKGEN